MAIFVRNFERPEREMVESYAGIGVATVYESLGKDTNGVMNSEIKSVQPSTKLLGPALTVECVPADNITLHFAMTVAKKGDVLIVNGGSATRAMIGELMCTQCKVSGLAGIVIDGAVRDVEDVRKMNFPCFTRSISPMGPSSKSSFGSINVPIQCGGIVVSPGDLVIGDDDGVVVVPRNMTKAVLERARQRLEKEAKTREALLKGSTTVELNDYGKLLQSMGVKQVDGLNEVAQ